MIDDAAVRAVLEAVLGAEFAGLTVTHEGDVFDPQGVPHIRSRLIRVGEKKVNNVYTIASGMFEVLAHVPSGDGDEAAESIAAQAKPLFVVDVLLGGLVRIEEVAMLSARPGTGGRGEGDATWTVCPLQIDWRVDQIG